MALHRSASVASSIGSPAPTVDFSSLAPPLWGDLSTPSIWSGESSNFPGGYLKYGGLHSQPTIQDAGSATILVPITEDPEIAQHSDGNDKFGLSNNEVLELVQGTQVEHDRCLPSPPTPQPATLDLQDTTSALLSDAPDASSLGKTSAATGPSTSMFSPEYLRDHPGVSRKLGTSEIKDNRSTVRLEVPSSTPCESAAMIGDTGRTVKSTEPVSTETVLQHNHVGLRVEGSQSALEVESRPDPYPRDDSGRAVSARSLPLTDPPKVDPRWPDPSEGYPSQTMFRPLVRAPTPQPQSVMSKLCARISHMPSAISSRVSDWTPRVPGLPLWNGTEKSARKENPGMISALEIPEHRLETSGHRPSLFKRPFRNGSKFESYSGSDPTSDSTRRRGGLGRILNRAWRRAYGPSERSTTERKGPDEESAGRHTMVSKLTVTYDAARSNLTRRLLVRRPKNHSEAETPRSGPSWISKVTAPFKEWTDATKSTAATGYQRLADEGATLIKPGFTLTNPFQKSRKDPGTKNENRLGWKSLIGWGNKSGATTDTKGVRTDGPTQMTGTNTAWKTKLPNVSQWKSRLFGYGKALRAAHSSYWQAAGDGVGKESRDEAFIDPEQESVFEYWARERNPAAYDKSVFAGEGLDIGKNPGNCDAQVSELKYWANQPRGRPTN